MPATITYCAFPDQRVQSAAFYGLSQILYFHGHELNVEQGQAVLNTVLTALQSAGTVCPRVRKTILSALIAFIESVDTDWVQASIGN